MSKVYDVSVKSLTCFTSKYKKLLPPMPHDLHMFRL